MDAAATTARMMTAAKTSVNEKAFRCRLTFILNVRGLLCVKGFNPSHIGIYLDTTHLALYGEPIPMAMDICRDYLSIIGVKDTIWERIDGKARTPKSTPLGKGLVDFAEMREAIQKRNLKIPFTLHTEYPAKDSNERIQKAVEDFAFLRRS